MVLSKHLVNLLKKDSIMINQEPCLGVKINSDLSIFFLRNSLVFLDIWDEWLSKIIFIFLPSGYFSSNFLRIG